MIRYPTTKQLRYFVALSDTRHFGRAAAACFVSQSAFSNAISELEDILDTQLVDRTNRQVTITSVGQDVAVQARLCLRDIESLVEIAGGERAPLTGELRLGVIPTIAPFLLPSVLPPLRKAYPDLKLYLAEDQTERIHERLMAGEVDVVLLALPYELRSVEKMPLFRDRFLLACREDTERIDPENYRVSRLDADSVLLLEDGHCLRDHTLAACRLKNAQNLGVTFLPEMASGSALLRNTRVKLYPIGDRSYRTIGLIWRKGSSRSEEFRLLGQFLKDRQPR